MPTTWSLTAAQVISGALEICGYKDPGETVSTEDSATCLTALDGILKELPLHGLSWPQLTSAAVAVTWSAGTPSTVSVPADFFGVPVLKFTDASGTLVEIPHISKPAYEAMDKAQTATYPQAFHLAPSNAIYLWPVPTQDPVLFLTYQALIADAASASAPGVKQSFLHGLQFWLADEVSLRFGVPSDRRVEISLRAKAKREAMLQWAVDLAPLLIEARE